MYDPRNILKQKPETVRDFILTILALLVALDVSGFQDISAEATALIGLVIYKALSLFYVEPQKKANIEEGLQQIQTEINKKVSEAPAVIVEEAESVAVDSNEKVGGGRDALAPRRPRRVEK